MISSNDVVDRRDEVVGRPPVGAHDHGVRQQLVPELDAPADRVVPRDGPFLRLAEPDRSVVLVRLVLGDEPLGELARLVGGVELEAHLAVPVDPEPDQRLLDLVDRLGDLAARVGVLDPQQDLAAVLAGVEPVEEEGPNASDMEEPGRARGHADADARHVSIVGTGGIRRACLLCRRDSHRHRPHRGDRRRLRPGVHAEPADVAADRAQAGGDRAVPRAPRRGGHRRRRLPRALPLQSRRARRRDLREVDHRRCARTMDVGDGDRRRRRSSSTSAPTSGRASRPGLDRTVAALPQILERCDGDTWLLLENSAGTGGTIGRSVEELATLVERAGGHPRLGVCLDSCHLYASGYDVTDPAVVDALVRAARRDDRPRPAASPARQRQRHPARLEPRPAREHPRGRDRRGPRRLPRPPRLPAPERLPRGAGRQPRRASAPRSSRRCESCTRAGPAEPANLVRDSQTQVSDTMRCVTIRPTGGV